MPAHYCQRCGIDMDSGELRCLDCVEVEADNSPDEVSTWTGLGPQPPDVSARVNEAIRHYRMQGLSDRQIGKVLGISDRTVLRRRQSLGLPGIPNPGRQNWTDESLARHAMCKGARHVCRPATDVGGTLRHAA
jgi:hypothetical protein